MPFSVLRASLVLLCKYTEILSSLQRFEARKWLHSVQNQVLTFEFANMPTQSSQTNQQRPFLGADILVNLRRLNLESYRVSAMVKRSTIADKY